MAGPVMVMIRFAGDVADVLPRWEQAVKLWYEQFGSEYRLRPQLLLKEKTASWSSSTSSQPTKTT